MHFVPKDRREAKRRGCLLLDPAFFELVNLFFYACMCENQSDCFSFTNINTLAPPPPPLPSTPVGRRSQTPHLRACHKSRINHLYRGRGPVWTCGRGDAPSLRVSALLQMCQVLALALDYKSAKPWRRRRNIIKLTSSCTNLTGTLLCRLSHDPPNKTSVSSGD